MEKKPIQPLPLSPKGKLFVFLTILLLVAMWGMGITAYFSLPEKVPVHFGWSGEPDRIGSRLNFLILPLAFSIAPIIILLVVKFRFTLINRYPYLVNLPAFFTSISQLPPGKQSIWVNRYFEAVLALGFGLALALLILQIGIFQGTRQETLPSWFMIYSLSMPIWLVIPFILYLRRLSSQLQVELKGGHE